MGERPVPVELECPDRGKPIEPEMPSLNPYMPPDQSQTPTELPKKGGSASGRRPAK